MSLHIETWFNLFNNQENLVWKSPFCTGNENPFKNGNSSYGQNTGPHMVSFCTLDCEHASVLAQGNKVYRGIKVADPFIMGTNVGNATDNRKCPWAEYPYRHYHESTSLHTAQQPLRFQSCESMSDSAHWNDKIKHSLCFKTSLNGFNSKLFQQ